MGITTAAYTILKNEEKFIEQWLYYTRNFTYRVLLDTGSSDNSVKLITEAARSDPNLIFETRTFDPWHFSNARNYNLQMVPDVDWALSPDLDEYFSINVLPEMEKVLEANPTATNISTTRLDIYAADVVVGPPGHIPTNKIHRRHDYKWVQPIYEHLIYSGLGTENEVYSDKIFLIHTQDFKKPERSPLYLKMLLDEYQVNPTNCWTLWFLVNHYYREKDLENFVKTGTDFVRYHTQHDSKYQEVLTELTNIYIYLADCPPHLADIIYEVIKGRSVA